MTRKTNMSNAMAKRCLQILNSLLAILGYLKYCIQWENIIEFSKENTADCLGISINISARLVAKKAKNSSP